MRYNQACSCVITKHAHQCLVITKHCNITKHAHHLVIITDNVDQAHRENDPTMQCYHQVCMCPSHLFILLLSKDEWIKIWYWHIMSQRSQMRGFCNTVWRKSSKAQCLARQGSSTTKAVMPGHLVDIIFKTEISNSDRWWQSGCFQDTSQTRLSGICIISSGKLQK